MKFKFKTQDYQKDAVKNIVRVFEGQPFLDMVRYTRDLGIKKKKYDQRSRYKLDDQQLGIESYTNAYDEDDTGFENANIMLNDGQLFNNILTIQNENNYKNSDSLVANFGRCSLDIEMETGTGKTYVYIKSIFELNEKYGWSKFIIVVPSVAIREGVKKSFDMMEDHFMEQYGKKVSYFIYDSKKLSNIDSFASSNNIQVMIVNVQNFNVSSANARRIDMALDEFQSRKPIDVLAKTRPILILDEPQKMGGNVTQTSLKKFNPLFVMNFSATHKKHNNLIYSLDALDAYNKKLVKKIQVKGFEISNLRGNNSYLYLQEVSISKDKPPMAKLEFEVKEKESIKRKTKTLGVNTNLYSQSNELEQYKDGYTISNIDAINNTITFLNGLTIKSGEIVGDVSENDKRRIQIRETILSHFQKEEILFNKGIKCLSLFFVDAVKKYRDYDDPKEQGEYAKIFEEEYVNILNQYITLYETPYVKYLKRISVSDTHKGYFSVDKKTGKVIDSKEKKGEGSDDISAYELILKNKERLLSFDEPTRFIFSHSALREGWDNPNVFQICALKPGGDSAVAKRQEVGRGLRIAVNRVGERADEHYCRVSGNDFHKINTLTVIATDSYKDFVSDIQKDIRDNLSDRPTRATVSYFIDKYLSDGTNLVKVDNDLASDIRGYLSSNNYIDRDGKLTDKYFEDKENNSFKEMPDIIAPFSDSIHKLVQGIFDERVLKEIIGNEKKTKIERNDLNENFEKFKTLWNLINHKYTYKVEFSSDELVNNAIKNINNKLFVNEMRYTVSIGEQRKNIDEGQVKSGDSFGSVKTRTEKVSNVSGNAKYDLIEKIAKYTNLTRKSVVRILQGISAEKFGMFKLNPEDFITKVSKLINDEKATLTIEHITYNQTDGTYDSSIFTENQVKQDYDKAFESKKAIQDYIFTDGLAENSVEKKFADRLESANEVAVYAKLPRAFQIPTPVGNYAPDWAIAFNDNCGIKHIYFIAETKGKMDSMEYRTVEGSKIECAKKLFNEISDSKVRYHDVTSYDDLLNVMSSIN